ncbi:hypothetical protein [Chitinophaga varians]|uniref:hypothetical protein n=1 Tax=Chitinophaga varians TaxID=2202339 RepID=UPI00165FFD7B|nr:hypothetical protein [Chitinophaga varians]MBC9915037.1 hypothetical protein [Chitinophaga varians]
MRAMDNRDIYKEKLTPSAKVALEEAAEEVSNKIFDRAIEIAQTRKTFEQEISLRDIIEAKEQFLDFRIKRERSEYLRRKLSLVISFAGAFYALAGMLIYLFQSNKFDLKSDLGLLVSGVGVLTMLSAAIYVLLMYKRSVNDNREQRMVESFDLKTNYDIVNRWQIIEKLAGSIMIKQGLSVNNVRSINSIINFLSSLFANDKDSIIMLKRLLLARNKIVHEGYQPSRSEKTELINFSNSMIEKLEDMQKSR